MIEVSRLGPVEMTVQNGAVASTKSNRKNDKKNKPGLELPPSVDHLCLKP